MLYDLNVDPVLSFLLAISRYELVEDGCVLFDISIDIMVYDLGPILALLAYIIGLVYLAP